MHGDVDVAVEQRVAQRADEDAGAAEPAASGVPAAWLRSPSVVDLDQLDLAAEPVADQVGDQPGLGGGEQRGAGADPDGAVVMPGPPAG